MQTPSEAFRDVLRSAVLSAPSPFYPPGEMAALFNAYLDRCAKELWAQAWHEGAVFGLARAPIRIEVTGCTAPAGGPCRLVL